MTQLFEQDMLMEPLPALAPLAGVAGKALGGKLGMAAMGASALGSRRRREGNDLMEPGYHSGFRRIGRIREDGLMEFYSGGRGGNQPTIASKARRGLSRVRREASDIYYDDGQGIFETTPEDAAKQSQAEIDAASKAARTTGHRAVAHGVRNIGRYAAAGAGIAGGGFAVNGFPGWWAEPALGPGIRFTR